MTQPCTNCGTPLVAGAAFCRTCGTKAEQPNACRSCGTANAAGATFCANCGNALQAQAQQTQYGTPQRPFQQPAMRMGGGGGKNKWMLPGIGGVIAAVVIVGVVLMMGGSDSEKKKDEPGKGAEQVQAKSVLPPDKVASSSEDLAATIASLNKSQLNVAALTSAQKPVDPKELDKGLADVAANSMRVAELANIMSKTASAQVTNPESVKAAAPITQQYEGIAESAYAQAIDAQNLRQQVAAGTATLPAITQTISAYGAQMWTTSVTIQGVSGNPFVPFIVGTPPVEISVVLTPAAVQTVTVQFGPNLSGWVVTNTSFVNWPIYVNLAPVQVFDPFDDILLRRMLTFEGQLDPYFSQRYALARLQQYRRAAEFDRLGVFSLTGITDIVNDQAAQGRYVNMYDLPNEGQLGLNLRLPSGIALSDQAQMRAGVYPSFANGNVVTYKTAPASGASSSGGTGAGAGSGGSNVTALYAKSFGVEPPQVQASLPVAQAKAANSITISNVSDPAPCSAKADSSTLCEGSVKLTVAWSSSGGTPISVNCDGVNASSKIASGSETLSLPVRSGTLGGRQKILCQLVGHDGSQYGTVLEIDQRSVSLGTAEDVKKHDDEVKKREEEYKQNLTKRQNAIDSLGPVAPISPFAQATEDPIDPIALPANPGPVTAAASGAGGTTSGGNTTRTTGSGGSNSTGGTGNAGGTGGSTGGGSTQPQAPAVQKPAAPAPAAPPPPVQPAVVEQNRASCFPIWDSGKASTFLSNTERTWFQQNCSGLTPGQLLNCAQLITLARTQFELGLKNSACPQAPAGPNCDPVKLGGGTVNSQQASGSSSPLTNGCKYRVCLEGTISAPSKAAGGKEVPLSPAAAGMKSDHGGLSGGCITVIGKGQRVTFTCDGGLYDGDPYGGPHGSFAITLEVLGKA